MKLPFRVQFILAPFIIVVLLACLVGYTLYELSEINRGNYATRQWVITTDRIQTAIGAAHHLISVANNLRPEQDIQQDEHFFTYLEQINVLADSLFDPGLFDHLPSDIQHDIQRNEFLLREPEKATPQEIATFLAGLLPALDYQFKLFAAQRRSVFIDTHKKLVAISTRMTTTLLSGLLLCIALGSGLAIWGVRKTRQRLQHLAQNAQLFETQQQPISKPISVRDELDDLQSSLADMTTRLLKVVSVEKVLQGAENERKRIAMEIHDGILADLTAINRKLDNFNNESGTQDIRHLRQDVDIVIQELRRAIDDLHPQVLETLGLESALQSYLNRHAAIAGFPEFHFDCAPHIDTALPRDKTLNLYRILTEVINNAARHAQCERLEISLRIVAQQLIATVEDNGIGMNDGNSNNGHGRANINERARILGATAQWRASRFANGTCFELKIPVDINDQTIQLAN